MKSEREGINLNAKPSGTGCVECLATDGWWLQLRRCVECAVAKAGGLDLERLYFSKLMKT
jgi:hypothetical protein